MSNTIHQNNSTVILPFWLDDLYTPNLVQRIASVTKIW